ncbi:MAG: hypothetical protein FRX49_00344 [Trebouxia sp. A1-2]|nr:MAG: hypothetical protein FRX49_00344 [Trebouxia sp. A1-2]
MARPLMKPMLKEDLALDTLYLSWACQLHRDLLPSSIPRLLQAVASDIVSGGIPGLVLCLGTKVAKEALKMLSMTICNGIAMENSPVTQKKKEKEMMLGEGDDTRVATGSEASGACVGRLASAI